MESSCCMPARIINIIILYFNYWNAFEQSCIFLTICFVSNFNSNSVGFSAQWFIGSFRPCFKMFMWEDKRKKKQHFKGLCHILPHPPASGEGDRRSVWLVNFASARCWLAGNLPLVRVYFEHKYKRASAFLRTSGLSERESAVLQLSPLQLCGCSILARLNQRFNPHRTAGSLPTAVPDPAF